MNLNKITIRRTAVNSMVNRIFVDCERMDAAEFLGHVVEMIAIQNDVAAMVRRFQTTFGDKEER